ncbi:unnamed protein product [Alopecurus aequalis]
MNHCRPPLEDEDLLQEILLRLPPQPSPLPRASLVCKRWGSILSEPRFLRRFRKHHRKPLLLGFFDKERGQDTVFTPMLDPPNRIPAVQFTPPKNLLSSKPVDHCFIGCRHGIALFLDLMRREAVLWYPLTSVQCRVAFPPRFGFGKDECIRNAAVWCPDDDEQRVHGDCHLSPFKLVLACQDATAVKASVFMYESKSGVWGDVISTTPTSWISAYRPSILVGNALFWLLHGGGDILEFDFERLTLAVIEKPANAIVTESRANLIFQILRGEDNGLGLAILSRSKLSIQLWARKSNSDGVVSWELKKTVQLDELFSRSTLDGKLVLMPGYDEDTNAIFLSSDSHDFILQLESMQFKYIGGRKHGCVKKYFPYTHFYIAGNTLSAAFLFEVTLSPALNM